jgi:hypothetical protein
LGGFGLCRYDCCGRGVGCRRRFDNLGGAAGLDRGDLHLLDLGIRYRRRLELGRHGHAAGFSREQGAGCNAEGKKRKVFFHNETFGTKLLYHKKIKEQRQKIKDQIIAN